MREPLLDAAQVAKLLRICPSTVYDAVKLGRLPAIELWRGRQRPLLRFRREDIEGLIQDRRTATAGSESGDRLGSRDAIFPTELATDPTPNGERD